MKKQTKIIIYSLAMCFVAMICIFGVLAAKNFSLVSGGVIEFFAPGVDATISNATLSGVSKKDGSGTMSTFTVTPEMTTTQIEALDGYKTWSGIKLLFDDESEGRATLSFTITNNSQKQTENIMVEVSSNTTQTDPIQVVECADFCINPGTSHKFTIGIDVVDMQNSSKINDFKLTVALKILKASDVLSVTEQKNTNGLTFSTNATTKTATLTHCTNPTQGASLAVDIPAVVKDDYGTIYSVVDLRNGAGPFESVSANLTSVTLPNTLTKIGQNTFLNCSALTGNLIIPKGVTEIGYAAFRGCGKLTGGLVIPNGIKEIEADTFLNCVGLSGNLVIPYSVTTIGSSAFASCGFTGDLIIPDSVTLIENSAFESCDDLSGNLYISKNITTISNSVFRDCKNLSGNLTLLDNITTIEQYAFYNCSGFDGELVIPNSVTSLGKSAFSGCTGFDTLTISNSLKTISMYAFYMCSGFSGSLIIPNSVETIGDSAFYQCSSFSGKLNIPTSVKNIEKRAFGNCFGLSGELVIPDSVVSVGEEAFYQCPFSSLKLSNNLTTISKSAFYYCDSLRGEVVLPDSVTTINDYAFKMCWFITKFTFSANVTAIGNQVLNMCQRLTEIVVLSTTPPTLGTAVFDGTNDCPIYVPAGSVEAYKMATNWSAYASRIQAIA